MVFITQGTSYSRAFKMIATSDHISAIGSRSPSIRVSKGGSSFSLADGGKREISNGWYVVLLNATDTNVLGDLAFYITGSGADDTDFTDQVISTNLNLPISANVTQISGASINTSSAQLGVNLVNIGGSALSTSLAQLGVNVIQYASGTASTNISGIPKVDTTTWNGTAVTSPDTAGSPKVTITAGAGAGQLDFTSGVVKANVTQFNGSGLSTAVAQLGVNVVQYAAGTVSTNIAGIPKTDIVDIGGAVLNTALAQLGVNVIQYASGTTSTNIAGIPKVDIVDISGSAVNTSSAQLGVNVVNYAGGAVSTNVSGTPKVDLIYASGTTLNAPIAHRLDVNAQVVGDKTGYSLAAGQLFVKKNAALASFMFLMVDGTDHITPKTGLTVAGTVSIDGAAFATLTNAVSELSNGIYVVNLDALDTNGTVLTFKFAAATADTRYITIVTQA